MSTFFPENTKGFLYYDRKEGQLRFRLTKTKNPKRSFGRGKDLLSPDGRPWHSVPRLFKNKKTTGLSTLLVQDGLLSKNLDGDDLPRMKQRSGPRWISKFGVPFTINLSSSMTWFHYLDHNNRAAIGNPLSAGGPQSSRYTYFFKGKRFSFPSKSVCD